MQLKLVLSKLKTDHMGFGGNKRETFGKQGGVKVKARADTYIHIRTASKTILAQNHRITQAGEDL